MDRDELNRKADSLLSLAGNCADWKSQIRWSRPPEATFDLEKSVTDAMDAAEAALEELRTVARGAAGKALVAADKTG